MNRKKTVVVLGQTPPPYNGQAKMIQLMIEGLCSDLDLIHVRMAYSDSVVSAGKFQFGKILHLIHLVRQTRRILKEHKNASLYYPPASPNAIPVVRDIIFLLAIRPFAVKTIFHFHSGGVSRFVEEKWWLRRIAKKAYGNADLAIELGESCPRDGSYFRARRIVLVPNGTNPPESMDVGQDELESEGSGDDCLRVLYVGIHTAEKGLFDLLDVAKVLKGRGVQFEIQTAGLWYTQSEQERFNQLRVRYGLEQQVRTLGQKTGADLSLLYRQADVFFFPTTYPWETFGMVQIEAMACGIPVVASDWQGPRDIVIDGKTGFLCPARKIESYADALQRLAEDSPLRMKLGAAARKRYEKMYTAEAFVHRMKSSLNEVL